MSLLTMIGIASAQMPPAHYVKAGEIEKLLPGEWGLTYTPARGEFSPECEESKRMVVAVLRRDGVSVLSLTEPGKASRTAPIQYMFPSEAIKAGAQNETAARLMLSFDGENEVMGDGRTAGWSITMRDRDTLVLWRWDQADKGVAYKRCSSGPAIG